MRTQTPQKAELFTSAPKKLILGVFAVFLYAVIILAATVQHSSAATAATLNFQARLESNTGAIAPDGNYNIRFKLYNASTGGSALWTETYQNSATQGIQVVNGYVTVNLGSITSFPSTINWDQDLYLTMDIGGTSVGASPTYDGEMNPRLKLTAVPYAFRAGQLATYNGATGYTSTLSVLAPTGGDQTFQIPDQGAAGTYSLLTTNAANNSFIQLQATTPGTAQIGNFNISGTGIANLLQAANIDTSAAGALGIGNTNATSINIGTNAAAHAINIGTGAASQTIIIGSTNTSSSLQLQTGTSGFSLNTAGKQTFVSTGNGAVIFNPVTDGDGAFQIQNAAGTNTLFDVDTSANMIKLHAPLQSDSYIYTSSWLTLANGPTATYTTPVGSFVPTKINVTAYDPGNFGQVLAMGIPSTSATTARVVSLFDARTSAHQPTITVFSPDESQVFGLSWDGSNSQALVKSSTSSLALQVAGANVLTANQSGTVSEALIGSTGNTGRITFTNFGNSNTVSLQSGVTAASYVMNLPTAIGTAGQCLNISSVAGSTQNLGYADCLTTSTGVQLQGATPGTAQTGNFNISGTGIAGVLRTAQLTVTGASNQTHLVVKANATQTTDILQVTNATGVVLSAFDQNGQLVLGTRTTSGTLVLHRLVTLTSLERPLRVSCRLQT
jgi:hypothetical protein